MSQNSNSWDGMGMDESSSNAQAQGVADNDLAQDHDSPGAGGGSPDEVLDIEPTEKPKSKAGLYIAITLVVLLMLGVVAFIGSKVYAILYPDAGGSVTADSRPLDLPPATSAMGDPASQPALPGGTLQGAAPAGALPVMPAQPPASSGMAPSVPPAGGPGPGGAAGPQAVIAPVCGPDLSATVAEKDREIAALRAELDAVLKRIAAAEKAAAARKASASNASKTQQDSARTSVAAATKPAAKPAPAAAKPADAPAPASSPKPTEAAATVPAVKEQDEARGLMTRFKLHAVYPNTGEFQSAHLIDRTNGRNVVVRVGDVIFGARVTRIDSDSFRVQTTGGEIR